MDTKTALICAVAVDGLPAFVCDDRQLQALADAGHRIAVVCPSGTGKLVANWRDCENIVVAEYDDVESGIIRAVNGVLKERFDWRTQDVVLVNNADCAITSEVIAQMRDTMHAFERRAIGCPRMDVEGWVHLAASDADFARDHLPSITRFPLPTSTCAYLKGRQLQLFGTFDESFGSLEGALQDYALRINAYGFDSVMLNHVFVSVQSEGMPREENEGDRAKLQDRYDYLDVVVDRFERMGIDPIDNLMGVIRAPKGHKPRILLDYSNMPPVHCGMTAYQVALARCLYQHHRDRYDVTVLTNEDGAEYHGIERFCDTIVYSDDDLGKYDLGFYAFQPTKIPQQIIVDRHCARMVYTMLDAILLRCYYIDNEVPLSSVESVRLGLENCDGIIAISDFSTRDMLDFFQDDPIIQEKPLRWMYVATDFGDEEAADADAPLPDEDAIPFEHFTLIAGNHYSHKVLRETVDALKGADHNFIVVGHTANEFIAPNVYGFKGGLVSDETLIELYRRCDSFIFPSVYEGFGLPIVNALKCGKTAIVNRNELNLEIEEHLGALADNMLFFDTFDELPGLVKKAESMQAKQAEYVDSWEAFTDDFCDFVDELLAQPLDLDHLRRRHYCYTAHWQQIEGIGRVTDEYLESLTPLRLVKQDMFEKYFKDHPERIAALHAAKDAIAAVLGR